MNAYPQKKIHITFSTKKHQTSWEITFSTKKTPKIRKSIRYHVIDQKSSKNQSSITTSRFQPKKNHNLKVHQKCRFRPEITQEAKFYQKIPFSTKKTPQIRKSIRLRVVDQKSHKKPSSIRKSRFRRRKRDKSENPWDFPFLTKINNNLTNIKNPVLDEISPEITQASEIP